MNVQEAESKAILLRELRDLKAAMEKEEETLKKELKIFLGDKKAAMLGSMVITLTDRSSEGIDKEEARRLLGDDFNKILREKNYQVLDVKRV
jgi:hypothetical protein